MPEPDIACGIFGDESVVGNALVFGIVAVLPSRITLLEHFIEALKTSYGGEKDDKIHCRELFKQIARKKHLGLT